MLSSAQLTSAKKIFVPAVVAAAPSTVVRSSRLLEPLTSLSVVVQFDRDDEIISQGGVAKYCFEVVSGCIRTVRLLEDGRRQVGEFLLPGDVLGCETAQEHEFGAEAVTPSVLRRYRVSAIEDRAARDLGFAQGLRRHSASQVRAVRGRLITLGRKTASERIASFLLEMQQRLGSLTRGPIVLPMSRGDIADYLGLTIETICRGLAEFRDIGIIAVDRARVTILDRGGLARAGSDQLH